MRWRKTYCSSNTFSVTKQNTSPQSTRSPTDAQKLKLTSVFAATKPNKGCGVH